MPATLELDQKKRPGGSGPGLPPRDGNGNGGNGADGLPDFRERLRRYRLGVALGLVAVVMLFVALTSAYIVRQGTTQTDLTTGARVSDWRPMQLPLAALLINTLILLASSVTLELARRALKRQAALAQIEGPSAVSGPPWLGVSAVLGFAFLAGQVMVWRQLEASGVYISTNPSSSFFYLLTGTHAVHLAGGVLAMLYAASTSLLHKSLETRLLVVDVTSLYWHFMAGLWIYVFALLEFAK